MYIIFKHEFRRIYNEKIFKIWIYGTFQIKKGNKKKENLRQSVVINDNLSQKKLPDSEVTKVGVKYIQARKLELSDCFYN